MQTNLFNILMVQIFAKDIAPEMPIRIASKNAPNLPHRFRRQKNLRFLCMCITDFKLLSFSITGREEFF